MSTSSAKAPELVARWFHAVDIPKHDSSPFKVATTASTNKTPSSWKPFSERDSANLEAAYQNLQRHKQILKEKGGTQDATVQVETKIPVNEDHLFEADVEKLETYPIYWHGPTYDIRRGTWFQAAFGGNYLPCDENLSRQVEDGYKKYQPWKAASDQPSGVATSVSSSTSTTSENATKPAQSSGQQEQRWALFGPYMNQYVIYEGPHTAFQFSDLLSSKIGRAVMNIGGTRLIRGWDEVEKLKKKTKAQAAKDKEQEKKELSKEKLVEKERENAKEDKNEDTEVQTDLAKQAEDHASIASLIEDIKPSSTRTLTSEQAEKLQEKTESEDYSETEDGERTINHLVLVIHGIGQKLGERVEAVNFVHDCNILRRTMKDSSRQYATAKESLKSSRRAGLINMPDHGGVQVLPVQWRQKIQFGLARKPKAAGSKDKEAEDEDERETTLEDITLEGVPSIRQLVSDVVLDVLLYMTPRYRQEMIKHVTEELNRIYRLFKTRNPKFNGKVSIYGHSLGSLLAFDILCNQHPKHQVPIVDPYPPTPGASRRPAEVDLTDLLHGAMGGDDRRVKGLMGRTAMRYDQLEFDVDRLFVVGSPVGLFLLLKSDKLEPRTPAIAFNPADDEADGVSRPAVNAMYNIFHPHDPVAYRIEPIVKHDLTDSKPVPIPYTKGGLKGTIVGIQDLGSDIADRGRSMLEAAKLGIVSTTAVVTSGLTSGVGRMVTMVSSINAFKASSTGTTNTETAAISEEGVKNDPSGLAEQGRSSPIGPKGDAEVAVEMREIVRPPPEEATTIERLNPRGRIDYVLQEGVLENPYISALGVHMNYWSDPDCALFVLRELYGEVTSDSNRLSGSFGSLGRDSGKGGSSGGQGGDDQGHGPVPEARSDHDRDNGGGGSAKKGGGIGAFVRGTTKRMSQMTPDDLSVFGKGKLRMDMSIPIVFPSTQGQPPLDAYSLL